MRIRDWSSDVCSSDLHQRVGPNAPQRPDPQRLRDAVAERHAAADMAPHGPRARLDAVERVILDILERLDCDIADHSGDRTPIEPGQRPTLPTFDRTLAHEHTATVVTGQSVNVLGGLGG